MSNRMLRWFCAFLVLLIPVTAGLAGAAESKTSYSRTPVGLVRECDWLAEYQVYAIYIVVPGKAVSVAPYALDECPKGYSIAAKEPFVPGGTAPTSVVEWPFPVEDTP